MQIQTTRSNNQHISMNPLLINNSSRIHTNHHQQQREERVFSTHFLSRRQEVGQQQDENDEQEFELSDLIYMMSESSNEHRSHSIENEDDKSHSEKRNNGKKYFENHFEMLNDADCNNEQIGDKTKYQPTINEDIGNIHNITNHNTITDDLEDLIAKATAPITATTLLTSSNEIYCNTDCHPTNTSVSPLMENIVQSALTPIHKHIQVDLDYIALISPPHSTHTDTLLSQKSFAFDLPSSQELMVNTEHSLSTSINNTVSFNKHINSYNNNNTNNHQNSSLKKLVFNHTSHSLQLQRKPMKKHGKQMKIVYPRLLPKQPSFQSMAALTPAPISAASGFQPLITQQRIQTTMIERKKVNHQQLPHEQKPNKKVKKSDEIKQKNTVTVANVRKVAGDDDDGLEEFATIPLPSFLVPSSKIHPPLPVSDNSLLFPFHSSYPSLSLNPHHNRHQHYQHQSIHNNNNNNISSNNYNDRLSENHDNNKSSSLTDLSAVFDEEELSQIESFIHPSSAPDSSQPTPLLPYCTTFPNLTKVVGNSASVSSPLMDVSDQNHNLDDNNIDDFQNQIKDRNGSVYHVMSPELTDITTLADHLCSNINNNNSSDSFQTFIERTNDDTTNITSSSNDTTEEDAIAAVVEATEALFNNPSTMKTDTTIITIKNNNNNMATEQEQGTPKPTFLTTRSLLTSTYEKDEQFKCHFCGKCFHRAYNLKSHIRSHAAHHRPFECPFCESTFSRNHDLNRHLKIHSREKPFTCDKCGRGFSRIDALKRHLKMDMFGQKHYCMSAYGYQSNDDINENHLHSPSQLHLVDSPEIPQHLYLQTHPHDPIFHHKSNTIGPIGMNHIDDISSANAQAMELLRLRKLSQSSSNSAGFGVVHNDNVHEFLLSNATKTIPTAVGNTSDCHFGDGAMRIDDVVDHFTKDSNSLVTISYLTKNIDPNTFSMMDMTGGVYHAQDEETATTINDEKDVPTVIAVAAELIRMNTDTNHYQMNDALSLLNLDYGRQNSTDS